MAVTLEFECEVSLRGLRQALSAVVVHAEPTKSGDEVSPLCRLRLVFARDEILVMASNSLTTAMASVDIDDGTDTRRERFAADDGEYVLDLDPGVARKILQQFKVARPTADAAAGILVHGNGFVSIEDRDGLLPGMLSRYPHLSLSDSFPDVRRVLREAAAQASGASGAKALIAESKALRMFAAAPVQYGRPLTFEAVGRSGQRGWWVWCGPHFQGLISSVDPGGDSLARRDSERMGHLRRVGLGPDPVAEAEAALGGADVTNLAGV